MQTDSAKLRRCIDEQGLDAQFSGTQCCRVAAGPTANDGKLNFLNHLSDYHGVFS
jgi:hypothetical protein